MPSYICRCIGTKPDNCFRGFFRPAESAEGDHRLVQSFGPFPRLRISASYALEAVVQHGRIERSGNQRVDADSLSPVFLSQRLRTLIVVEGTEALSCTPRASVRRSMAITFRKMRLT